MFCRASLAATRTIGVEPLGSITFQTIRFLRPSAVPDLRDYEVVIHRWQNYIWYIQCVTLTKRLSKRKTNGNAK